MNLQDLSPRKFNGLNTYYAIYLDNYVKRHNKRGKSYKQPLSIQSEQIMARNFNHAWKQAMQNKQKRYLLKVEY